MCADDRARSSRIPWGLLVACAVGGRYADRHAAYSGIETSLSAEWAAPLPDFSAPALSRRLRIGAWDFAVQLTSVQRGVDGEGDTDVVQLRVLHRGRPLALADLGLHSPACLNLWSYLCNKLTEAVVDFYGPRPRLEGEPNPRLGCWGPRPDLSERGMAANDCGLAVVIGLATWTAGARPLGNDQDLLERLFEAVVGALGYWVLVAQREHTRSRRN